MPNPIKPIKEKKKPVYQYDVVFEFKVRKMWEDMIPKLVIKRRKEKGI